jgi:transposase-like protein
MTVPQACHLLGIGESRFHALRNQWLQEALDLLEPRPLGRPAQVVSPEAEELARLQAQNRELEQQCRVAEVREELARTMPYVLQPADEVCKRGNATGSKPR